MPKISVVIPVYNAEKYIAETLECIINQTMSDIEIICVNDASNDRSIFSIQRMLKMSFRQTALYRLEDRDINPKNILIKIYDDVQVVKISDFGLIH